MKSKFKSEDKNSSSKFLKGIQSFLEICDSVSASLVLFGCRFHEILWKRETGPSGWIPIVLWSKE
jgi:hypothetical protein